MKNAVDGAASQPIVVAKQGSRVAFVITVVSVIGIAGCMAVMAHEGWPSLHHDALVYVTPAINFESGQGWSFAVFSVPLVNGARTDWSFNAHGQLYQSVLAWALSIFGSRELMLAVGALNVVTVLLLAVYLALAFRAGGMGAWGIALWTIVGVAGTAAILLWIQGRPEQLLPLLLAVTGMARLAAQAWWARDLVAGITIGLLGATSPLPGILAASTVLILLVCAERGLVRLVAGLAIVAVTGLVVWYATIWASCPYDPMDVLRNTFSGAGTIPRPRGFSLIPEAWFFNPSFYLVGVPFAAAGAVAVLGFFKVPMSWPRRAVVAVLAANLSYWVANAGIIYPGFYYNLLGFYPLMVVWTVQHLAATPAVGLPRVGRKITLAVLWIAVAAASTGLVRHVLLLTWYNSAGLSLENACSYAAAEFKGAGLNERIAVPPYHRPCPIVLDGPPWHTVTLCEDVSSVPEVEKKLGIKIRVLFWPQTDAGSPPEQVGPFRLAKNYWVTGQPSILGVPLDSRMPGYQFAVYKLE
jgi:hypothetical protein